MLYRIKVKLAQPQTRLWLWPVAASIISVLVALGAAAGDVYLPNALTADIDRESLDDLLSVIASSMLGVTTFSLAIMVSAFAAASSGATPRATELVMGDDGTRQAISAFIAAFIYAVVAKVALSFSYYGQPGRFILFVCTMLVLAYLIVSLLRWVGTLATLGRLNNTLDKIEAAASKALDEHRVQPDFGAKAGTASPPEGACVFSRQVGYVSHIDADALERIAAEADMVIHVRARPGQFVGLHDVLAIAGGALEGAAREKVGEAFVISKKRSYDQDPRFGLIALSEVAQRALSPGINDPGTAIQVMSIMTRLLARLGEAPTDEEAAEATERSHLTMIALTADDLVRDGFEPIGRDGAAILEVGQRMQKLLAIVAGASPSLAEPARQQAARALERAEAALSLPREVQLLQRLNAQLFANATPQRP